jgi:hypothetical protein
MRSSTPFPLLRTYLSTVHRKFRFIFLNALNLASIALAVIGFSTQNLTVEIISIGGLLIGVIGVAVTTWPWYKAVQDLYVQYLPRLSLRQVKSIKIPRRLLDSDYELLLRRGTPSDALLTSMRINRALFSGASSNLRVQKEHFRAPHPAPVTHVLLREFTQKKSVILFNGRKIRLASDLMFNDDGSLMSITIQQTRYFETMVTNDSLRVRLMSNKTHGEVFVGNTFCFPEHEIPTCEQSACANQVGASTIAVTSDEYLIVVEQGRRANISKSMLSPSGSGSADWKDVGELTDLQQLVKRFAARELAEECGLTSEDVAWLRIVGYGRFIRRGGLPQFFCLAKLNCSYEKIRVTWSERGLTDRHERIDVHEGKRSQYDSIQMAVKELRKEDYRISSSLWWNLELLSLVPEGSIENAFR